MQTEDEIIPEADDVVERETPHLVTARECGFLDTRVETGHEEAAVRIAAAVYFRWHVIEETDVLLFLVLDRIQTKSPLHQVIRNSCLRHQSVYQNKAMAWYKRGVLATIEAIGGRAVFDTSTTEQRQAVWRALFSRDPLGMAKASMPSSQLSIDIRGIYRSADPKAHTCRRFIKTCFVWMAEDTYNYRIIRDSDDVAFMNWKKMPGRRSINALELGDCSDVPVQHGGMFDRDRMNIGMVAMTNPSFIVEDD